MAYVEPFVGAAIGAGIEALTSKKRRHVARTPQGRAQSSNPANRTGLATRAVKGNGVEAGGTVPLHVRQRPVRTRVRSSDRIRERLPVGSHNPPNNYVATALTPFCRVPAKPWRFDATFFEWSLAYLPMGYAQTAVDTFNNVDWTKGDYSPNTITAWSAGHYPATMDADVVTRYASARKILRPDAPVFTLDFLTLNLIIVNNELKPENHLRLVVLQILEDSHTVGVEGFYLSDFFQHCGNHLYEECGFIQSPYLNEHEKKEETKEPRSRMKYKVLHDKQWKTGSNTDTNKISLKLSYSKGKYQPHFVDSWEGQDDFSFGTDVGEGRIIWGLFQSQQVNDGGPPPVHPYDPAPFKPNQQVSWYGYWDYQFKAVS